MASGKSGSFRFDRDLVLADYAKENWPEHSRRVNEMRRGAPLVRFYYPLVGFLSTFILMGGFTLLVAAFAKQQVFGADSADPRAKWMQELLVSSVPVLWVATALVVAFVVFACIAIGVGKSREMFFQAEKLEMKIRKEYYLHFVCAGGGSSSSTGSSGSSDLAVPVDGLADGAAPVSQKPDLDFDPRA